MSRFDCVPGHIGNILALGVLDKQTDSRLHTHWESGHWNSTDGNHTISVNIHRTVGACLCCRSKHGAQGRGGGNMLLIYTVQIYIELES